MSTRVGLVHLTQVVRKWRGNPFGLHHFSVFLCYETFDHWPQTNASHVILFYWVTIVLYISEVQPLFHSNASSNSYANQVRVSVCFTYEYNLLKMLIIMCHNILMPTRHLKEEALGITFSRFRFSWSCVLFLAAEWTKLRIIYQNTFRQDDTNAQVILDSPFKIYRMTTNQEIHLSNTDCKKYLPFYRNLKKYRQWNSLPHLVI